MAVARKSGVYSVGVKLFYFLPLNPWEQRRESALEIVQLLPLPSLREQRYESLMTGEGEVSTVYMCTSVRVRACALLSCACTPMLVHVCAHDCNVSIYFEWLCTRVGACAGVRAWLCVQPCLTLTLSSFLMTCKFIWVSSTRRILSLE